MLMLHGPVVIILNWIQTLSKNPCSSNYIQWTHFETFKTSFTIAQCFECLSNRFITTSRFFKTNFSLKKFSLSTTKYSVWNEEKEMQSHSLFLSIIKS